MVSGTSTRRRSSLLAPAYQTLGIKLGAVSCLMMDYRHLDRGPACQPGFLRQQTVYRRAGPSGRLKLDRWQGPVRGCRLSCAPIKVITLPIRWPWKNFLRAGFQLAHFHAGLLFACDPAGAGGINLHLFQIPSGCCSIHWLLPGRGRSPMRQPSLRSSGYAKHRRHYSALPTAQGRRGRSNTNSWS